ncbi:MAG: N-6 DNA methylase [Proteobacteria bacterium]|nr:N-6 DNA methylase [Pseudomonadota bacterium]
MNEPLQTWLERLGYADEPQWLHRAEADVPRTHAYSRELRTLLSLQGGIRAKAVFDVEGVPSVAFLASDDGQPLSNQALDEIRQKVWNQNLINIVIDVSVDRAQVMPARRLRDGFKALSVADARSDGEFSALDISSANVVRRLPDWFDTKARVDSRLLANLSEAVKQLSKSGFDGRAGADRQRQRAELLMGQVMFLSYLEHREIVGETYRKRRNVVGLHELVAQSNREGVRHLIDSLQGDFNGDFLSDDRHDPWGVLNRTGFELLHAFLSRTDLKTGQGDFWNYDFKFIPVELLSGLYESFLSPDVQARTGAYYTPRHLATLAVDQALVASPDPLAETVFDGACGSGILLTTIYRRLIALKEARDGGPLSFKGRRDLLVQKIFGADIHQMACRVTAFSLYLSLLEGLDPADIMEAQKTGGAKLPNLAGKNLLHGDEADIFNPEHGFARKRFSLAISNPPWGEASGRSETSADKWKAQAGAQVALRQIAAAFALRVLDFVDANGRICLILPIGLFLAPTNAKFIASLFTAVRPDRLINFGDLQALLFPSAEHTCHVFLASRRTSSEGPAFGEVFDYCVPKADVSLAFGRLTMQSADRQMLQTLSVIDDPRILVTLMWGNPADIALIGRLAGHGTLDDLCGTGSSARLVARKGIHTADASRDAVDAGPLRRMRFVPVEALGARSPVLHPDLLTAWPRDHATVVGLDDRIRAVFKGPRVLFTDGFSREDLSIRAVYYDGPASFTHSIAVIAGDEEDAPLLKLLAAFLRSSLAQYFLMMTAWKMLCERNAVHLVDVQHFPFFEPSAAPNPRKAREAMRRICASMNRLAALDELDQRQAYEQARDEIDSDVFDYFDLSADEKAFVLETVSVMLPSIRPRSYSSLNTVAQRTATKADIGRYARALGQSLTEWRKRTGGRGRFDVDVNASTPARAGGIGVAKIAFDNTETTDAAVATTIDDQLAHAALNAVRQMGLFVVPSGESLHLIPDAYVWSNEAIYLARPLIRRNWTLRQAGQDAEHIVRDVQSQHRRRPTTEVA